ncbi:unnamed protein product [Periconia digitata]|uniref:Uncharacterized protein n=1 Tax=Periconia digitata TaxID=1303443 RepID=A0A9W4XRX1_9PLEO|nr:unnamed protein product [Periconia digitata]
MRCFLTKAVLLALATLAIADDRCTNGPFVKHPPQGGEFIPRLACHTKWDNGEVIVGVEAWASKWQMRGIRFKYSQWGWGEVHGSMDADARHEKSEWSASEQVNIKVWNNKPDDGNPVDAVGRIRIEGNNGRQIFDIGANGGKTAKNENYGADMGSGIILGAQTFAGLWLNYVEFNMLRSKVKKAELVDVKYGQSLADLNKKQEGIDNASLMTMYFVNDNPVNGSGMIYDVARDEEVETEQTITTETTNEWTTGVEVTVGASVGIPLISASAETTTSVGFRNEEYKKDESKRRELVKIGWKFRCDPNKPLPPQQAVKCTAKAFRGEFDSSYEGHVEVELVDGTKYKYKETGTMRSVSYMESVNTCSPIDIKKVPGSNELGDHEEIGSAKELKKRSIRHSRVYRG